MRDLPTFRCGFCGRSPEEAGSLAAGRGTYICRDCARQALEACAEEI
ncbi:MAG: ClpX C4-type zinc finger protein [Acidimicrobiia bacterium]